MREFKKCLSTEIAPSMSKQSILFENTAKMKYPQGFKIKTTYG